MQDAHLHLQDPRLLSHQAETIQLCQDSGITHCVVNGTHPTDWTTVTDLSTRYPHFILPAYGLHPWKVNEFAQSGSDIKSQPWFQQLSSLLVSSPQSSIGECGLDRWIPDHNLALQQNVLRAHLQLAADLEKPITLHCLRAWGALIETLQEYPLSAHKLVLHSYGGPAELIPTLLKLGCYFSFSGYFLHPKKSKVLSAYSQVPLNRLLVETDSPDMLPPKAVIRHSAAAQVYPLNHPVNLLAITHELANALKIPHQELQQILTANFQKVFLSH